MAGLAGSALAQTDFGILLGISSSSLHGDTPPNGTYTTKSSLLAGLSVEFGIGNEVYLIAQPQYLTRGTKVAFAVPRENEPRDSLTLSLSYLSIPVGLKVKSGSGRFYVSSVLEFGILTSATVDNGATEEDVENAVDPLDIAVGLGVGGQFSVGRRPMTVELRYSQSLLNLPSEGSPFDVFPTRFRMAGLQLVAGFYLGLGGT